MDIIVLEPPDSTVRCAAILLSLLARRSSHVCCVRQASDWPVRATAAFNAAHAATGVWPAAVHVRGAALPHDLDVLTHPRLWCGSRVLAGRVCCATLMRVRLAAGTRWQRVAAATLTPQCTTSTQRAGRAPRCTCRCRCGRSCVATAPQRHARARHRRHRPRALARRSGRRCCLARTGSTCPPLRRRCTLRSWLPPSTRWWSLCARCVTCRARTTTWGPSSCTPTLAPPLAGALWAPNTECHTRRAADAVALCRVQAPRRHQRARSALPRRRRERVPRSLCRRQDVVALSASLQRRRSGCVAWCAAQRVRQPRHDASCSGSTCQGARERLSLTLFEPKRRAERCKCVRAGWHRACGAGVLRRRCGACRQARMALRGHLRGERVACVRPLVHGPARRAGGDAHFSR